MSHSISETRSRTPMWVYEKNFLLVKKLLNCCLESEKLVYRHHFSNGHFEFTVVEQCKYTYEMDIKQYTDMDHIAGDSVSFRVRICMDAGVAEVVSYLGRSRLLPSYEFPNEDMWQPDEKKQANLLLHDCLLHVMSNGIQTPCTEC